jgi:hypothetical protein
MLQVRCLGSARRARPTLTRRAQVFVFDTRRGVREGEEQEKVLAFFPSGLAPEQQQARASVLRALPRPLTRRARRRRWGWWRRWWA